MPGRVPAPPRWRHPSGWRARTAADSPRRASRRGCGTATPFAGQPSALCPAGRVALGVRSCTFEPWCLGRLRMPVRPFPLCTARPAPRTLRGADALTVLRLPCGGASPGLAPQAPSGPPTCLALLSPPPTLFVDPDRPSGRAPQRVLGVGFWGVTPLAVCLMAAYGAVSRCGECGLPCGLRGARWTLHPCRAACPSFTGAPRGRRGG